MPRRNRRTRPRIPRHTTTPKPTRRERSARHYQRLAHDLVDRGLASSAILGVAPLTDKEAGR